MGVLLAIGFGLIAGPTSRDSSVVPLPTSELVPGMACNGALLEGQLTVDGASTLVVQGKPILWPLGYVGRARGDVIEILNPAGEVVARTGDVIQVGGGGTVDGFKMCPHGPTVIQAGRP